MNTGEISPPIKRQNSILFLKLVDERTARVDDINIEKLKIYLKKNQIETRRVFMPLNLQKPYLESSEKRYAISKELYDCGLCLPTYPYLEDENIEYIIEKVVEFIQEN